MCEYHGTSFKRPVFEAQAFLLDELDETHAAASRAGPSRFTINSDSALRRLMEARPVWDEKRAKMLRFGVH